MPVKVSRSKTANKNSARVTARDVANAAGVAIGTVSRVVNGASNVRQDIREAVERAIAELGWTPSVVAQTMRGGSTRMVGFIFSDIRNPLYSSMIKGAEDVLSEHGYMLVVASSNGLPKRETALISLFKSRYADGLLFSVEEEDNPAVLRSIQSAQFPVVMLERDMGKNIDSVGAAHKTGVYNATRYLISMGHRRIAMISGGHQTRVGRDRLRGLIQAHEEAGLTVAPELLRLDSFLEEYGYREANLLLDLPEPPTAIIAAGMHLLPGVLQGIRAKGKRIPEDVSLIASNDTQVAQLVDPPVTVIRYDGYALGKEAAQLLLRRMTGEEGPASYIEIPSEFVIRGSCAARLPG